VLTKKSQVDQFD